MLAPINYSLCINLRAKLSPSKCNRKPGIGRGTCAQLRLCKSACPFCGGRASPHWEHDRLSDNNNFSLLANDHFFLFLFSLCSFFLSGVLFPCDSSFPFFFVFLKFPLYPLLCATTRSPFLSLVSCLSGTSRFPPTCLIGFRIAPVHCSTCVGLLRCCSQDILFGNNRSRFSLPVQLFRFGDHGARIPPGLPSYD